MGGKLHREARSSFSRREILVGLSLALATGPGAAAASGSALDALLARRRMVRRFKPDAVSDETVRRLIDTARRAPSAGHTEPWAFVVVRDAKTRAALGRAAFGQNWLAAAPVSIVACAELQRSRRRYGERGDRYAVVDASFAALLLLLAVVESGLGACFVGAFDDRRVAEILSLPGDVQPLAIIPVGYPAEKPAPMKLRPRRDVVHRERW